MNTMQSRRGFLGLSASLGSAVALSGCDALDGFLHPQSDVRGFLEKANDLTYRVQRMLLDSDALAAEFAESEIRQPMRPNGVTRPEDMEYMFLANGNFALYRLEVGGLVDKPLAMTAALTG